MKILKLEGKSQDKGEGPKMAWKCAQPCCGGDPCEWDKEPKWIIKGKVARCPTGKFIKVDQFEDGAGAGSMAKDGDKSESATQGAGDGLTDHETGRRDIADDV